MNKRVVTYTIFVLAILFIIIGIVQSGYTDTLNRAGMICLECVGIG